MQSKLSIGEFVENSKLMLSKPLATQLKQTLIANDKKILAMVDDGGPDYVNNINNLSTKLANGIASDLEKSYIKTANKAKDIDIVVIEGQKSNVVLDSANYAFLEARAEQQANIIANNVLSSYIATINAKRIFAQNLLQNFSTETLVKMPQFKALNASQQKYLTQSLAKGTQAFNEAVGRVARQEYITKTKQNVVNTVARSSYHETAYVVENTRLFAAAKNGKKQKEWVGILDRKIRAEHSAADGQTVDIDKPFQVISPDSGVIQYLMHPGDTSLGADISNVINCRCFVWYL